MEKKTKVLFRKELTTLKWNGEERVSVSVGIVNSKKRSGLLILTDLKAGAEEDVFILPVSVTDPTTAKKDNTSDIILGLLRRIPTTFDASDSGDKHFEGDDITYGLFKEEFVKAFEILTRWYGVVDACTKHDFGEDEVLTHLTLDDEEKEILVGMYEDRKVYVSTGIGIFEFQDESFIKPMIEILDEYKKVCEAVKGEKEE